MTTTRRFPKLVPLLAAAALTFTAAACGDDDDDDDVVTPDAAATPDADTTPDAEVPDAEPAPVSTRSGSIVVVDTRLVTGADPAGWYRGALIDISMVKDPPDMAPDFDNLVPPGVGCKATKYDLAGGDSFATQLDEGAITIADTASPLGPCVLSEALGEYTCFYGQGALAEGDSFHPNGDCSGMGCTGSLSATITIAGATFDPATQAEKGMWVSFSGFPDPTAGTLNLDPFNGKYPVMAVASATQLVVAFPVAAALPDGVIPAAGGTYVLVSGAGPSPANVPFLTGVDKIKVSKAMGPETDAFTDLEVPVGGDGFMPTTATFGAMVNFPSTATDPVDFSCNGEGGTCGTATGTILVISATSGTLTGSTDMPEDAQWVSVSCRAFGDTVSLPVEVVDLIESIGPTRIRTSMFRANFGLEGDEDGTNQMGVVTGFGVLAFSTPGS